MVKIRDDLEGVVYPYTSDGITLGIALRAGDDVPAGVVVGEHLLAAGATEEPESDGAPKGNASREAWAEYAESLGIDVPQDAKQKDIRALVAEHQA